MLRAGARGRMAVCSSMAENDEKRVKYRLSPAAVSRRRRGSTTVTPGRAQENNQGAT